MDLLIDGQPAPPDIPLRGNLDELLATLHGWALGQSRVILGITLDGVALTPERLGELGNPSAQGLGKLEIRTTDRLQLARDTLRDLSAYTKDLAQVHQEAADKVIAGEYSASLEVFGRCFKGWSLLASGVRSILPLAAEGNDGTLRGMPETLAKTAEVLNRFKDAFAARDPVRLGDLAQYELMPHLEEWKSILQSLRDRFADEASSS